MRSAFAPPVATAISPSPSHTGSSWRRLPNGSVPYPRKPRSMMPTHDRLDHTARILVVDDDAPARAALEAMLAPEGYVVLAAASGKEAMAIVAQHAPDLMLLDVIMPDMDGYDVVRMMKAKLTTK